MTSISGDPTVQRLRSALLHHFRETSERSLPDAEFNELALAVFRYQFSCNSPYRAFCRRRGARPDEVEHWKQIPAVPTAAFKAAPLVCGDREQAMAVFRTSGTTAGSERRGEHVMPELDLYDAALRAGFRKHLLPGGEPIQMLSLVPASAEAPDSSLSYMIGEVMQEFGTPESRSFVAGGELNTPALIGTLRAAEEQNEPVCLLGTSLAWVRLLEVMAGTGDALRLAEGSRLMDTGGFKGRIREVTREELYRGIEERLGIGREWCVNEYGMTEMSSQFYDAVAGNPDAARPADRLHQGSAWVRTVAVDPETLEPVAPGEPGILRHWDLANLHSVLALQTEDLGVCFPGSFRLLGRAPGAEPRGCSLAMDDLLRAVAGVR